MFFSSWGIYVRVYTVFCRMFKAKFAIVNEVNESENTVAFKVYDFACLASKSGIGDDSIIRIL